MKLLNDCLYQPDGDGTVQDNDILEKWHISLPQERMLSALFTCDMTPAGTNILDMLHTIMARISIDWPRITRKWVVERSEVWPKLPIVCSCHLQDSEAKLLPKRTRLGSKTSLLRWQRTLLQQSSVIGVQTDVKAAGLEAVPLDTLLAQTQESLKQLLEPQARVRLQGVLKCWTQVLNSIEFALKDASSQSHHVLKPEWRAGKFRCVKCPASYDLSVRPVSWRKVCASQCSREQLLGFKAEAVRIFDKVRSLVFLDDVGSVHPPVAIFEMQKLKDDARLIKCKIIFEKMDPCLKYAKNRR